MKYDPINKVMTSDANAKVLAHEMQSIARKLESIDEEIGKLKDKAKSLGKEFNDNRNQLFKKDSGATEEDLGIAKKAVSVRNNLKNINL